MTRTTGRTTDRMHRAVVIGGSMAGLVCAAALAPHADEVVVLDRDDLPDGPSGRRGVPQGHHAHALLPAGLEGLEALLPGLQGDLLAAGAQLVDPAAFRFHIAGGRIREVDYERDVIAATRPLVEWVVRERVRALPTVRLRARCDVTGLRTSADRSRVTGVDVLPRDAVPGDVPDDVPDAVPGDAVGGAEAIDADLVVDASGRGSRTPRWLVDLGYDAPSEDRIHIGVHYTTRTFHRRADHLGGAHQVVVAPMDRRGGIAQVIEPGDRWIVTLLGYLGERAPEDLDGFVAYARDTWCPDLHAILADAEPIGEARTTTYPASTWRRYDRLTRFPEGMAVVGDAVCGFNPVYGQGMSVAVQQAHALADVVAAGWRDRVGLRTARRLRPIVAVAWSLAGDADLADPGVEGPRTARWRIVSAYLQRLLPVAHHDPVVALTFLHVIGLVAPPPRLMHPRIAWRVLRGHLRHRSPGAAAGGGGGLHPSPTPRSGSTVRT